MRRKAKNNSNGGANTILSPLAADKKKVVLAACLIAVMAFMWFRVLRKDAPQAAEASSVTQQASPLSQGQPNSPSKISFVELPKVAGRHEVITRDFFTPGNWWKSIRGVQGENSSGTDEVKFLSSRGDQGVIDLLAARLKLGAIVKDKNLQVFMNGKLLSVGDKLLIREGVRTFECEVVGIEENQVAIRCGQAEVTLKLKQIVEVND
jgi:preprotein translocase subunit YajC